MIRVEAPRDAPAMESGLELGENAAVTHSLDALALVPLRDVRSDEWEGHGVEPALKHRIDVVDELPGNAVLVGGHAEFERAHRPLDRGPVKRREARPHAERAPAQGSAVGRKDRRGGIVLLDEVLEPQEVFPGGGKCREAAAQRDSVAEDFRWIFRAGALQEPRAVARAVVLDQRPVSGGGPEPALCPALERDLRAQLRRQCRPGEAEIRADARIPRDQQTVL